MGATNTSEIVYGANYTDDLTNVGSKQVRTIQGLGFPIGNSRDDGGGDWKIVKGKKLIRQHIKQLALTDLGERVMRPQYGMGLRRFLFEQLDQQLANELRNIILLNMRENLLFVEVLRLKVFSSEDVSPAGGRAITIELTCRIKDPTQTVFDTTVEIN